MKVKELVTFCKWTLITPELSENEVNGGYVSDLLSDVMAHAKDGNILITIQAHQNTVAVASLTNLSAILICHNREIPDDMLQSAKKEKIAVLRTKSNQYDAACNLFLTLRV